MLRTASGPPLAIAVIAAVVIAACGSNSPGSSTSAGQVTQAQFHQDAVRFARCMRSHGASNFPDPTSPREFKFSIGPNTGASPRFHSAETACGHLLPDGGPGHSPAQGQDHTAAALAFARCMRSHGFPNFPDPTASGQLSPEMVASAGINLHQPAFLQAADACVGVTHGVLTRADVARAVNSSNGAGH
jgi:hypothetical protein